MGLENTKVMSIPLVEGHEAHPRLSYDAGFILDGSGGNVRNTTVFFHQNADGFHMITQHYMKYLDAPYKKKIALWVWELSEFRKEWIPQAELVDEIWVPSIFVKEAIQKTVNNLIRVVPYPLKIDFVNKTSYRKKYDLEDKFIFSYFFDASSYVDRKNPIALIKAFNTVLSSNPNSFLLLKISHANKFSEYLFEENLSHLINESILIIDENMDKADLYGLLNEIDCYVSPHRSEGFGLTIAEAMLIGKPVVCTNYSAPCDFINEEICFPVDFELVPIRKDLGPYQEGMKWAEINNNQLIEKMIFVIENKSIARGKGLKAKLFIEENYSYEAISKLIKKYL
jgi:glycosyltransferase involved in cell wall biosynthesis